jgi:hypothetical protein
MLIAPEIHRCPASPTVRCTLRLDAPARADGAWRGPAGALI